MLLWNLLSALPFLGGIVCLVIAFQFLTSGEILGAVALALFGIWSVRGGLIGMTRKEWPHRNHFSGSETMKTLTIREQEELFELEIARYVREGWRVVKRSKIEDRPFALLYRGNEACNLTMDDKGRFYPVILRR